MALRKNMKLQRPQRRRREDTADVEQSTETSAADTAEDTGRFRLQVDRQTKGSYESREAAEKAALAVKRGFPILHVAVFDADEGQSTTIALPDA